MFSRRSLGLPSSLADPLVLCLLFDVCHVLPRDAPDEQGLLPAAGLAFVRGLPQQQRMRRSTTRTQRSPTRSWLAVATTTMPALTSAPFSTLRICGARATSSPSFLLGATPLSTDVLSPFCAGDALPPLLFVCFDAISVALPPLQLCHLYSSATFTALPPLQLCHLYSSAMSRTHPCFVICVCCFLALPALPPHRYCPCIVGLTGRWTCAVLKRGPTGDAGLPV